MNMSKIANVQSSRNGNVTSKSRSAIPKKFPVSAENHSVKKQEALYTDSGVLPPPREFVLS